MSHSPSTTEHITVRGLRYGIRHWGDPKAPRVFFLHGWMDSSATFQFVVDALKKSWHVIAPDWRGYGQLEWLSRPYWFPDYYADLHCILEVLKQRIQNEGRLIRSAGDETTKQCDVVVRDVAVPEGFSHIVTSMTAPVASGWSLGRVGFTPTGKRRLFTAHTLSIHSVPRI